MKKDKNSFNDMMYEDTIISDEEKEELVNSKLGLVSQYVVEMSTVDSEIAELQNKLKEKQARKDTISQILIPELFDELQMSKVALKDGSEVEVKETYAAGITKEHEAECFAWLKKYKHDGIITHEITTKLKKGDAKHAKELMTFINSKKLIARDKKSVHPQTLKAFVKEQIESEATTKVEFPRKIFSVFTIKQTKVSKK